MWPVGMTMIVWSWGNCRKDELVRLVPSFELAAGQQPAKSQTLQQNRQLFYWLPLVFVCVCMRRWAVRPNMETISHDGSCRLVWQKMSMWTEITPNQQRYIVFGPDQRKGTNGPSWCESSPKPGTEVAIVMECEHLQVVQVSTVAPCCSIEDTHKHTKVFNSVLCVFSTGTEICSRFWSDRCPSAHSVLEPVWQGGSRAHSTFNCCRPRCARDLDRPSQTA